MPEKDEEVLADDPITGDAPKTVSQQETPEDQITDLPGGFAKFDQTTGAAFPNPEAAESAEDREQKARDL